MKSRILINFIIVINTLFVILFLTIGILALSVRQQLINPSYYKSALDASGIYKSVDLIATDYTQYLIVTSGENLTKYFIDSFIPQDQAFSAITNSLITETSNRLIQQKSRNLSQNLVSQLELSNRVQTRTEQYIDMHIKWLGSKDGYEPAYFRFIPDKSQIELVGEGQIINLVLLQVIRNFVGINNLPTCETSSDETNALMLITQNKSEQILCTSKNIDTFINQDLMKFIPQPIIDQSVQFVQSNVSQFSSEVGSLIPQSTIDSVVVLLTALSNYKEALLQVKSIFENLFIISIALFIFALLIILLNISLMKKGKRINYLLITVSLTGVVLIVLILAYLEVLNQFLLSNYLSQNINIENGIITGPTNLIFNQSLNELIRLLGEDLFNYAYEIGAYMLVIGTFGYLGKEVYDMKYSRKVNQSL